MLYLGIDQHSKQITVCVRDDAGEVVCRRQVSTTWDKVRAFFDDLVQRDADFMAVIEVCGFNDWLITMLREYGCREIVLIHPEKTSKKKTDRRDASQLAEVLWLNRDRLAEGQRPQGIRRVHIPTAEQSEERQMTALRKRVSHQRTRTLNKIHRILHRHNLMQHYPTKTFQTQQGRQWLQSVALPAMDRLEMDLLLRQWDLWDEQLEKLDKEITQRTTPPPGPLSMTQAQLLTTTPGINSFSGLTLASRIGDIDRFPRPRSLANYFGLTPGCRNSGNNQNRLGAITKQGSGIARFVLGQAVVHVLKKDKHIRAWYQRIKSRRGSKIARVAVMRRLTTIIWHMLKYQQPYYFGGPPPKPVQSLNSGSTKGTVHASAG